MWKWKIQTVKKWKFYIWNRSVQKHPTQLSYNCIIGSCSHLLRPPWKPQWSGWPEERQPLGGCKDVDVNWGPSLLIIFANNLALVDLLCLDVCSSILSTSFACFLSPASLSSQFLPLTVTFANVCLTTLSVVVSSGCLRIVFLDVSKKCCALKTSPSWVSKSLPSILWFVTQSCVNWTTELFVYPS